MYNIDMEQLGKNIRNYRKSKNMSIQDLGTAIGKSKPTVARYENGEIVMDMITILEICNVLNIDINDICELSVQSLEKDINENPFNSNLIYLYYISKEGIIISSLEIEEKKYANYVLMKNGINGKNYKQDYTGVLESNYNTAFICLTNAINNPGLDKFQVEIDLHSKVNNMYYGLFLGISDYTHKPTARKCIASTKLINSKEGLNELFNKLTVTEEEATEILKIKYWDLKASNIRDYVIKI